MRERVFEPLAMHDTAFSMPARALAEGRVATGLSGILFTQRQMTSPEPPPLFLEFWEAARGGHGLTARA